MKKLLFLFAVTVLLSPFAPQAKSQDVSVDFFYNNLNGGSWVEVGNYGYCWQPDVAVSDSSWRPYADGYWAYTDEGWTWVSYEDFGWATYHYGRWVRLADYGWVWKPGYEWGPAWVSWRFGGGYAGWAPLPPETEVVYESQPLTGHLDVEFDIGPGYYNFVDLRYIGEPVLRSRIVDVNQNVTYINQTVNVTNITYKNKTVYNYGPDLTVVNQYSSRPIQKLKLERQSNVDFAVAAKSGGLNKVQGNALVVAAPMKLSKPDRQIAPPTVKTKWADAKVEKGWSVAGDANAQTQLKEKIKTQDLKKVPPPTAGGNAAAGARASVAPTASLAPGIAPVEKGKKGKAAQFQAGATATPAGGLTSPAAAPAFPEKAKHKGKLGEQAQPGASLGPVESPGGAVSPYSPESGKPSKGKPGAKFGGAPPPTGTIASPEGIASPLGAPEYGKPGKNKRDGKFGGTLPPTGPSAGPDGVTTPEGKRKGFERQNLGPTPVGSVSPGENFNQPRGKHNKQFEQQQPEMSPAGAASPAELLNQPGGKRNKRVEQPAMSPSGQEGGAPVQGGPYGEGGGKNKAESLNAPPLSSAPMPAGQTGEQKHQGNAKGKGETPTPAPQ